MRYKLLLAALVTLGYAGTAVAQVEVKASDVEVRVGGGNKAGAHVDHVYRASTIVGMNIKNHDGTNLGTIRDLVVGLRTGKVQYAALSFGGILGFGEKLFAVPWHELELKITENDKYFVMNMDKARLEKAPGFDANHWPNTREKGWSKSVDDFYTTRTTTVRENGREVARETTTTKHENDTLRTSTGYDAGYRISEIQGLQVRNNARENMGHINELVIDLHTGEVRYVALQFGDTLGFGGKLFAMPWKSLTLHEENDGSNRYFALNVPAERLREAPGFDKNHWPDTASTEWRYDVDRFYNTERRAVSP